MPDTAPWLLRAIEGLGPRKSVGALSRELGVDQNTIRSALAELSGAQKPAAPPDRPPSPRGRLDRWKG